jgi:hypothetical protein
MIFTNGWPRKPRPEDTRAKYDRETYADSDDWPPRIAQIAHTPHDRTGLSACLANSSTFALYSVGSREHRRRLAEYNDSAAV